MLAEQGAQSLPAVFRTDTLEQEMLKMPQADCPVCHHFAPGLYIREVTLHAGTLAVGHAQREAQQNIMLCGRVAMLDESGAVSELVGPLIFVGKPGRKVGYVMETTVWLNVYPNPTNETDVAKLEEMLLDKTESFKVTSEMMFRAEEAQRAPDREDFLRAIAEMGFSPETVRAQSEDDSDRTEMPHGWPNFIVSRSPIEGLGGFVTRSVGEGEIVAPARVDGRRTPAGRYVNHSRDPNARMQILQGNIYLVALRPIRGMAGGQPGEEVTVDYRRSVATVRELLGAKE